MILFFLWHHVLTANSHCGLSAAFLTQQQRDKGTISALCQYYCPAAARIAVVQSPCASGRPQNLSKAGDFIRSYRAMICRNRRKISSPPLPLHITLLLSLQWNETCSCMDGHLEILRSQARSVSIT